MVDLLLNARPLIAIGISAFAALVIFLSGERVSANVRESYTFIAAIIKVVCIYSMLPMIHSGQEIVIDVWRITDRLFLMIHVDSVGMIFACIASALWIVTSVYSIGYMREHGEKNQTGYYASFAMCLCGTIGICFAGNLLTFFLFFEILTVATYPLVAHQRDAWSKQSGRKYLFYTLASGQLLFAGIVFVYFKCGTLDFAPGGFVSPGISGSTATILFFLMISAGAVKAGVMPLHSWLPAAMVAPTPVSALLHAVAVVNAGAFAVIRIVCYTFGPELSKECGGSTVMAYLAAITIILSSLIAIQKTNLKARLAYSTIGQLSYMVLGVCMLSPLSVTGAMYHMMAHSFLKITSYSSPSSFP